MYGRNRGAGQRSHQHPQRSGHQEGSHGRGEGSGPHHAFDAHVHHARPL